MDYRSRSATTTGDFIDVNGDGLVDWVRSYADGVNGAVLKYTWLNTGRGWVPDPNYILPGKVLRSYHHTQQGDPHGTEAGSFMDINRDGLVDWVISHLNRDRQTVKQTFLNTGIGWGPDNSNYHFPNIFVDNDSNEAQVPMHFGGIMDLNSDGAHDYLMSTKPMVGGDIVATYLGLAKPADMITYIKDSLGAYTIIAYKPMTDNTVYGFYPSWYPNESYRGRKVIGPSQLVSNTWHSNGLGEYYWLGYFYYNALHDGKRGFLGFAQRNVWDPQTKTLTAKSFYQKFPATGISKQGYVYYTDNITSQGWVDVNRAHQLLSNSFNFLSYSDTLEQQGEISEYFGQKLHPSGKSTYIPLVYRTRQMEYEYGQSAAVRSIWTNFVYDEYANILATRVATVPGDTVISVSQNLENHFYTYTQTTFNNDAANWLIGLPTEVSVTHHVPGQPNQVRETQMVYDSRGLLVQTIVEPNQPAFRLVTTHGYDGFGNEISTTVSGQGIVDRTSTTSYDSNGMYVISKTNVLGHSISITPDPKCEAPASMMDANGLVTTTTYDQFCRITRIDYPDGTWATTDYGDNPLSITQQASAQPEVISYYDTLGRVIKVETRGFDGRKIFTEKSYNHKGQITQSSLPYYQGETIHWTKYFYDAIGRKYLTRAPDNSETRITYNGLTTISINPLGQTRTHIVDIAGRLTTVVDADGNEIDYSYDSVGNLLNTTDPENNQVKMGYDHAGRKIWMDDPDMGYWTYEYDVLGQLIKQTDAKGQIITTAYDKLGRLETRTVNPANGPNEVSTWHYDAAANGIGALDYTTGPDGYYRQHTYDTLSRPATMQETIKGVTLSSTVTYDSIGRVKSMRYPGHSGDVYYDYNTYGYPSRIYHDTEINGQMTSVNLWVPEVMDAKGNITQERYGNGVNILRSYHPTQNYLTDIDSILGSTIIQDLEYTVDAIGNLRSRADALQNTNESFTYDNLNRLALNTATVPDPTIPGEFVTTQVSYGYDVLGNLRFRSDVGTLEYGQNGYGPHAVTSVTQTGSNVIPENVYNPYGSYSYDANGNITGNGQRAVDWTGFNKPKIMEKLVDGVVTKKINFTYGSDFQRVSKTIVNGKTTLYFGGGLMEHISENDQTFYKYYIPAGSATLEVKYEQQDVVDENNTVTGAEFNQIEKHYLFKDNIGSTDVIVDDNGHIVERLSFNPWGERRNSDWNEATSEIVSRTNRGFTGHEMDDEIGLINMNARIYDPVIGWFLSPDALIPSPTDLQSYNRYSYVRNNPLSFTDPSGHA